MSKKQTGRIVAVANQKGGVGKTTTTLNFSGALALTGKRVLIVDSDPQGNASSGLGIHPGADEKHLYHGMCGDISVTGITRPTSTKKLFVIPTNIDLVATELEIINEENREYFLQNLLEPVRADYDFIIIDCPPSLGLLTVNGLTAADSVLIPMQCEYFAMEGLAKLINTIRLVKNSFNSDLYVEGLLLTMFDTRNRLSHQVAAEVRRHFTSQVFQTVIPRNVRLSECPSHGKIIMEYDNKSNGAQAYNALAREFLKPRR